MSLGQSGNLPAGNPVATELHLMVLHNLISDAHDFPGFITPYINFIRSLRERVHPIGVSDLRVVKTVSGLTFTVNLGDRLGSDFYYGYYAELYDAELFMALLTPGATVLDVGANFGYYTVRACEQVGARGLVHAFDADREAYKLLVTNVEGNGLRNVTCHNLCIGETDGSTDFFLMEESAFSGMSVSGRAKLREKVTVKMRGLDSLLGEVGVDTINAMKIDVEGYEYAVLRGCHETIRRSPEVVVMLEVSAKNLDEPRRRALELVLEGLYAEGFRGWTADIGPDGIRPLGSGHDAAAMGSANIFLVRSGTEAERRLREAARDLRCQALRSVTKDLGLESEILLRRNAADPHHSLNLHAALLGAVLRGREVQIDALQARLEAVELDSKARLDAMRKGDETIAKLRRQIQEQQRQLHGTLLGNSSRLLRWIRRSWLKRGRSSDDG